MKVKWVRTVLKDLEDAAGLIARDDPEAARKIVKRIWDSTQLLKEHPYAGHAGRVPGTRELVVADTPFIIPYRVVEDTVQILRILHGKRKWPDHL